MTCQTLEGHRLKRHLTPKEGEGCEGLSDVVSRVGGHLAYLGSKSMKLSNSKSDGLGQKRTCWSSGPSTRFD